VVFVSIPHTPEHCVELRETAGDSLSTSSWREHRGGELDVVRHRSVAVACLPKRILLESRSTQAATPARLVQTAAERLSCTHSTHTTSARGAV